MALVIIAYVLIFGGFFYYMSRSNKKRQNKYQTMLSGITKGTKVLTKGGLIGDVTKVDEESITIKSANSIIEIHKGAIDQVLVDVFEEEEETISTEEVVESTDDSSESQE